MNNFHVVCLKRAGQREIFARSSRTSSPDTDCWNPNGALLGIGAATAEPTGRYAGTTRTDLPRKSLVVDLPMLRKISVDSALEATYMEVVHAENGQEGYDLLASDSRF